MNFNTFVVMVTKQLFAQNRLPFHKTVAQAFDRKETNEELNQKLATSTREIKYNRNQAKPVQQIADDLANCHFD